MKRFFGAIKRFFVPPAESKTILRVLPLFVIAFLVIVFFSAATYAWEESNSVTFCGLTCHTMPPEYITHQDSPHTNVTCEDCHMGRDRLSVLIGRKARYSWQTGSAMVLNTYEFPIVAKNMAPAREACENCHKPEKFSSDKLSELKHYAEDEANSLTTTFLVTKTGGGTKREGLGFGIHWHVENPVFFYATDSARQDIPYVLVTNPDGSQTEYIDIESGFDSSTISQDQLQQMDCITCHNRTAHMVDSPHATMDELIGRELVSVTIPDIKMKGVEVLSAPYTQEQEAMDGIAGLKNYYQQQRADFYAQNSGLVDSAILAIQEAYKRTNFPDQKVNWETHPNNLAHKDSPGCFRCHDGKHLTSSNQSIRLECNICHSIPVVSSPDEFITNIEISGGPEPDSHQDSNWINLHRNQFDESCSACHSVEDPGGSSNQSFCSNSACHGSSWEFAGFDAPKVREILGLNVTPTPAPTPVPEEDDQGSQDSTQITYQKNVAPILKKCAGCHGSTAQKGVNLTNYAAIMEGGDDGPIVVIGDPDASPLVIAQSGSQPHFMQLKSAELETLIEWIKGGALEK